MKNLFIIFVLIISFNVSAKDLQVGWELWFPYQYRNSQQDLVGLDFEILNTILAKTDYKVAYTELPWKRHLHYIKTGQLDVAMGASYNEERLRYAMFTQAYRQETVNLFVKKGTVKAIKLNSLSDLISSEYMIGIESGYYYGEEYQALMKNSEFREHISEVVDIEENVTLLMQGHIDGLLVDPATIKAFSKKYQMNDEFEQHTLSIYQSAIHFMFSKASVSPETVQTIDNIITDLKASGELDTIIQKWQTMQ